MRILYQIGNVRFIVKDTDQVYLVSLKNKTTQKINEEDAESILRQGYWQTGKDDEKIKEACASLIHPI